MRVDGRIVERPQFMIMRVAIGIHKEDIDAAIEVRSFLLFVHRFPRSRRTI